MWFGNRHREGAGVDIGLALTYITKDPGWVKKVLIGGIIVFVSTLFTIILVGLLGWFIFGGYVVRTVRNVINGDPNPLPEWDDMGGDLSRGLKGFVGLLVWLAPVWILSICAAGLNLSDSDGAAAFSTILNLCLVTPLSILLSVFVLPVIIGRFSETEELGTMFQFGDVIADIRATPISAFLLYFVLTIITGLLSYVGLIACLIGVVFTIAYAQFANAHGIAQIRQRTREARLGPAVMATDHPAF